MGRYTICFVFFHPITSFHILYFSNYIYCLSFTCVWISHSSIFLLLYWVRCWFRWASRFWQRN